MLYRMPTLKKKANLKHIFHLGQIPIEHNVTMYGTK